MDWIQLAPKGSMTETCDHADEPSISTKGQQCFGLLSDNQLLKDTF
jgi:hypothetical protein